MAYNRIDPMKFMACLLLPVFMLLSGCSGDDQCQNDTDCPGAQVCREGKCQPRQPDGGLDGDTDGGDPACPRPPSPGELIINEILADPPGSASSDLEGDANGDGTRSATQDEFVEVGSLAECALLLEGVRVADSQEEKFTFPADVRLEPGRVVVVFGGGTPLGDFGGAQVFAASGLALNNDGDTVELIGPQGTRLEQETYATEAGDDQSLTRFVDLDPDTRLVKHTQAPNASGRRFSPGTRVDGTSF
jgi:hypothetical protein